MEGGVMALTDAERKLLEELEATLTAQDPKLASKFSQPHRRIHPTTTVLGAIGFLLGMAGLVAGMSTSWAISVAGFVVMLVCAILVMSGWTAIPGDTSARSSSVKASAQRPAGPSSFLDRMEKRWRDRLEE
jgi:protein-S-isoprenylcysteine O-methyltransferase Ste14